MPVVYPSASAEIAQRRRELAPDTHDAFREFSKRVFAEGAVDRRTKQLIAVAVAHVTQCPYADSHPRPLAISRLQPSALDSPSRKNSWAATNMRAFVPMRDGAVTIRETTTGTSGF